MPKMMMRLIKQSGGRERKIVAMSFDLKWLILILFTVRIAIVRYYENYQGLSTIKKKSIFLRHATLLT